VRTLVVSDLHIGARIKRDVLACPEPLQKLLEALQGTDRLVLLGDVVELMERRATRAMAAAEPVMRAIGETLGNEREVVVVPGNHDLPLVGAWVRASASEIESDSEIPLDATPTLARLTSWLAPARVRVHYPGVWLGEGVWATHGHYLDRHLLPGSSLGIVRGLLTGAPRDGTTPGAYELARGPSLTRIESSLTGGLPRPLATLVEDARELARAATMPGLPRLVLRPRMAPMTSMLLGAQMRRVSIPALLEVVRTLRIEADWVLFGHVHRLGPLERDAAADWEGAGGRPMVLNTGSWVYEPLLVHSASPPHPYWPGGAVILDDDHEPRAVGLLDDVDAGALHKSAQR